MKEQLLKLLEILDDEVAGKLAKTAKRFVDAMIAEGFSKSEAIELLTHIQGK